MSIPDFQALMLPILRFLDDDAAHPRRKIAEAMERHFELSLEERAAKIASGAPVIHNRTWWALSHLYQAGVLDRPSRGVFQLSSAGRLLLASQPASVNMTLLMQYPSYVEFRNRKRTKTPTATPSPDDGATPSTPQDLVAVAEAENRGAVEGDVLSRALALTPTGFEDLVIRLLEAMGYGRAGSVERTSTSGDAGVDGIISQDPLGLDRIYVQAKRYAQDRTSDRPQIHGFAGALLGKQGAAGSSSQPPSSHQAPPGRRRRSTHASSSSTGRDWPSCWCTTASAYRWSRPCASSAWTRTTSMVYRSGAPGETLPDRGSNWRRPRLGDPANNAQCGRWEPSTDNQRLRLDQCPSIDASKASRPKPRRETFA